MLYFFLFIIIIIIIYLISFNHTMILRSISHSKLGS